MNWDELREEMLLEPERSTFADRRAASLRRWLRNCAADPACSVREGAAYALTQKRAAAASHADPTPEWLALREDLLGEAAEGEDPSPADHPGWAAADQIAAARSTVEQQRSLAAELLGEINTR